MFRRGRPGGGFAGGEPGRKWVDGDHRSPDIHDSESLIPSGTILIADDDPRLRRLVRLTLERAGWSVREAVDLVIEEEPDVVLMDILMPLLDGLEASRRILRGYPSPRIVVLTGIADPDAVLDVLCAGACGLVAKTAELTEVKTAVRAAAHGRVYVSPELAGPVLTRVAARPADEADDELARLSTRERGIVQLIGEGESTREISEGLFISPKTVAQHKSNIVKKLGLKSTRDLQVLAAKRAAGWLAAAVGGRLTDPTTSPDSTKRAASGAEGDALAAAGAG